METEAERPTPLTKQLKLLALFTVGGGAIGGCAAMLALFVLTLVFSPNIGSILVLPMVLPMSVLIGVVLGFVPSLIVYLIYLVMPRTRHPYMITAIGAVVSAIAGAAFSGDRNPLPPALTFAFAGAVAAFACLKLAERWKLAPGQA